MDKMHWLKQFRTRNNAYEAALAVLFDVDVTDNQAWANATAELIAQNEKWFKWLVDHPIPKAMRQSKMTAEDFNTGMGVFTHRLMDAKALKDTDRLAEAQWWFDWFCAYQDYWVGAGRYPMNKQELLVAVARKGVVVRRKRDHGSKKNG